MSVSDRRRSELARAGLWETSDNIARWGGLTAEEILDAVDRGFPDALQYRRLGRQVGDFSEVAGIPQYVRHMLEAGISRATAERLARESSIAPQTLMSIMGYGISERRLLQWLEHDDNWPRTRRGVDEVTTWMRLGFEPSQMLLWTSRGNSLDDAERLITRQFTVKVALRWVTGGWSAAEAKEWFTRGFKAPGDTQEWLELFESSDALRWIDIGIDGPAEALEWSNHFSPQQASKWLAHDVSPTIAARRAAAGIQP